MITNTGKSIIAKYLIEQAPSYASYIAVGCGANPRSDYDFTVSAANIATNQVNVTALDHTFEPGDYVTIANVNATINGTHLVTGATTNYFTFDLTASNATNTDLSGLATIDFKNKEYLDFEMFRVPITSRGYIVENGESKVVFGAELPTQERYYLTEAGLISAGSNPIAVGSDSRMLYNFSSIENWEYHSSTVQSITAPTGSIADVSTGVINSSTVGKAFLIDNTDSMFSNNNRSKHLEQPRMLKNSIAIAGNMSKIDTTSSPWTATSQPHIHLTSQTFPFDVNSSSDELLLAFSVLKRGGTSDAEPTNVYLMLEFSSEESSGSNAYARMQITLSSSDFGSNGNNGGYYYFVKKNTLAQLLRNSGFVWKDVSVLKVYAQATTTRTVTDKAKTGTTATITCGSAHNVEVGESITVSGVDTDFNGTYTVTAKTDTTLSYTVAASGDVSPTAVSPVGSVLISGANYYVVLDGLRFENNFDRDANPLYGTTAYSIVRESGKPVLKEINSKNILDVKLNIDLGTGA